MEQLLKPAQVADKLQISIQYLYQITRAGKIRSVKIGERMALRYRPSDIKNYIENDIDNNIDNYVQHG